TRLPRDWSSDVCSSDLNFFSASAAESAGADDPTYGLFVGSFARTHPFRQQLKIKARRIHMIESFPCQIELHPVIFKKHADVAARSEERRVGKERECMVL